MKQYKSGFLVLIGLAFATLLAVINFKGLTKPQAADPAVSIADQLPVETNTASQQMAVEIQLVTAQPAPLLQPVTPAEIQSLQAPQIDPENQSQALSFIKFLALPENYDIQGYQSDWQAYRQYRRTLARPL